MWGSRTAQLAAAQLPAFLFAAFLAPLPAAPAQDTTPDPAEQRPLPDLETLAARLDEVHREGRTGAARGFSAELQLNQIAADADALSITLQVDFGLYEISDQTRQLIRYRVQEEGRTIERGAGPTHPMWSRIDDEVVSLLGRDYEEDRRKLGRDRRLARQLLEYLDPGSILRRLRNPEPVQRRELETGRRARVPCLVVAGTMDSFPLYDLQGGSDRAHLQLWIEEEGGRLVAVQATGMTRTGARDPERVEFLRLFEFERRDGILFPGKLRIFRPDDQGRQSPEAEVILGRIALDPDFPPEHFDPK